MSEQLKNKLIKRLSKPLAGVSAQSQMSPSIRRPPGSDKHTEPPRKSAIMILLFGDEESLSTLYIKRPEYKGHHSGQMAFPGGKMERTDSNLAETAIRECKEEIGIQIAHSEIIGQLTPLHIPVSNLDVFSYVAYLPHLPAEQLDHREVAYTVKVPIATLGSQDTVKHRQIDVEGIGIEIPYYAIANDEIWGATAMITAELLAMISL